MDNDPESLGVTQRAEFGVAQKTTQLQPQSTSRIGDSTCLPLASAALAKAQGLGLPQYVQRVLKEQVSSQAGGLSPAERAAAWLSSTEGLPLTPPLSDDAMSRECMMARASK